MTRRLATFAVVSALVLSAWFMPIGSAQVGVIQTVGVSSGGTGLRSYTIGDLLYASATTTLSKLAAVASGSVLCSAGVGTAPQWCASPLLTATVLGSADTSGVRLDVESGFLACREGDDSAYCDGIRALIFQASTAVSVGTNPAQTGPVRIPNNTFVTGRDGANTGDYRLIGVNGSNAVSIDPDGRGVVFGNWISTTQFTAVSPSLTSGYATGSGGTVTQATNKTTGVEINRPTGQITLNNASLDVGFANKACFTVTNSVMTAAATVSYAHVSGGTANAYLFFTGSTASGSFSMCVVNTTGGALGEAPVVQFAIHRGATS